MVREWIIWGRQIRAEEHSFEVRPSIISPCSAPPQSIASPPSLRTSPQQSDKHERRQGVCPAIRRSVVVPDK